MSQSDTADSSPPLDQTQEQPIELANRIVHRFFEPIMLLVALIHAVRSTAKPHPPDPDINIQDPKQLFCAFVNKLSHVCDRAKGGNNVTSFLILKDQFIPDRAHYIFAANRQSDSQLQATAAYIRTLLRKVGQAPEGRANQHDARRSLLYHILRFNRPRVSIYLRKLQEQAVLCLEKCQAERSDDNDLVAEDLTDILNSPFVGSNATHDAETDYINLCKTMMQFLIKIDQSIVGEIIEERALEDRMVGFRSRECWPNLLHTIRRILAYQQSVQFFLSAKEKWPSLFENFTVSFISSSRPVPKPIRKKSLTAESIVGRMTGNGEEIKIFRDFVQTLQAFDLDDRIKDEYSKDSFKPTVHAEVLLLNWISKQGDIVPSKFFNEWKYIGSSKPTCKLCDYYFHAHKSNVEHRTSHGNLYPSWRVPDVFPYQGEAGLKARQVMVDNLLQRVRKDAFDIVTRKAIPSMKGDDSNTFTARVTLMEVQSLHSASTDDTDDVASMLGELDID